MELPSSIDPQRNASTSHWKPGTVPLPADASTFVIRLSNPAAGLNDQNRVENEVATMSLFRHALSHFPVQLVPAVYDWASAANGQGWILQEYMNGRPLDKAFEIMSLEDKKELLMQMAEILYALQHYQLPSTIKEYGGLTFDEAGNIISAPMTLHPCGPFQNYEELYTGILQSQLATVEANPWVKGWRLNGVRERLDNFISKGLGPVIRNVSSHQKILVHGDFSMYHSSFT